MLKYIKVLILILITTVYTNAIMANDYTNWSFFTKMDMNLNLHNSQGIIIPNICPECIGIKDGSGLGYALGVGVLYKNKATLLGMKNSLGVLFSYNSRNAILENQAFLGNIIVGNTVTKGLVNYSLDSKTSTLELEPMVYLYPIFDIPISLKLGISIAVPLTKQIILKEEVAGAGLLLPNGKQANTYPELELPNTASLFIGIPIGLKYDLYSIDNFRISPEINYNIALTDFQSDSKWNLSKLSAGFVIEYRLNKSEIALPKEPPMPNIPVYEEVKTSIECFAKWKLDNTEVFDDSEVVVNSLKTDYYHTVPILPFIFFEHNSAKLPLINNSNQAIKSEKINNDFQNMQNNFLADIFDILKKENNIKITAYYIDNEEESVGKARLDSTIQFLKSKGISSEIISSEVKAIKTKSIKYPQLEDEFRSVKLNYNDINSAYSKILTASKLIYSDLSVELELAPLASAGIKSIEGEVFLNKIPYSIINDLTNTIYISKEELASRIIDNKIIVEAIFRIEDNSGNSKEFAKTITIRVNETQLPDILNYVQDSSNYYHEYILALNSFDKQSPFIISDIAKTKLIEAINTGNRIQILGLTDNLGDKEYNSKLAIKRIKSLLKILKIDNSKLETIIPDLYLFDNNSAIGRMLNRSVVIRIFEN